MVQERLPDFPNVLMHIIKVGINVFQAGPHPFGKPVGYGARIGFRFPGLNS